jgi:protein-arginine kinase activator protein McsA
MLESEGALLRCHSCDAELQDHPRRSERICLSCRRERGRQHYRANREYYLRKARTHRSIAVQRAWTYILTFLETNPCVDCGESDPRVLEFDHRDRASKKASVSVLVTEGYAVSTIAREISKCDVRCANCHTIKTREESGWFRSSTWRARRDSNSQPFDP